ncbi:P-loop containing nucleoside triphosphate hydrolase protein [Mortierella sp. GBAus27b]|nr:hypothetical protein BGX31_009673 [Mortierella sp. GBA43]KAI8346265.1 P-loop containing nucleoside triphosphate hydrolase protein [Mortierella sp. GBAus27b]
MEDLIGQRSSAYRGVVVDAVAQAAFNEKKWVWVEDKEEGYIAGWIAKENGDQVEVHLNNGMVRTVNINLTGKMNPPKFDKVEDMADLTYLNEASVIHNLRLRYHSNLIYTYSGLFLVAVNPYRKLGIYTDEVVAAYKHKKRHEMAPHIYAVADAAYHDMLQDRDNQSILITGESGAGKTENTKKVIQYLASTASDKTNKIGKLEQQILQANPILESFGNAQTIRNNNSSRFGKFIRIEFTSSGHIAGGNIERYLFEKSRVTFQTSQERNYHIFYQLLAGASSDVKKSLLLDGGLSNYGYVKNSNHVITGVDDNEEFKLLLESMDVMGFTKQEQNNLFRVIAGILHLGNIVVTNDRSDQAQLKDTSVAEKVCHVLGIPLSEFVKGLLKPKVKAGREWVVQARTDQQVLYSIEALSKALYERMFDSIIARINHAIDTPGKKFTTFIGVLDIAGFEIFEVNSFEQLCINYTNEKLQQFFNHHMFILEQDEYKRESIEWQYVDFGQDLQPTIQLIEDSNPIGILSCLDEECVVPKGTDKTFLDKLTTLWKGKSDKYETPRFQEGFILHHYAGKVEYKIDGWLDKNKDPLNENITRLLAQSSEKYIASLFTDYLVEEEDFTVRNRTKKGAFRTVAQRHKEQLRSLMDHLYETRPHFVRCILPNEEKRAAKMNVPLVLDQLRCNGVLEGIRICRAGFPNRILFAEFRQRYEILSPPGLIPGGYMDGRVAAQTLLEALQMDKSQYRVGTSKVFFRSGVLAELEDIRDQKLSQIFAKCQAVCRGYLARRHLNQKIDRAKAIKIIQRNARVYVQLREWSWWKLYVRVKPLLNVTRVAEELRENQEKVRILAEKQEQETQARLKLEEASRAHEAERARLEELLQTERNLSIDNEQILIRTQTRASQLEDRVREIEQELAAAEAQLEELTIAKSEATLQLKQLDEKVGEQNEAIERLEKEKSTKEVELRHVSSARETETVAARRLEAEKQALEVRLEELHKEVDEKEVELERARLRLKTTIEELESKIETVESEKLAFKNKHMAVEAELKQAKEQAIELGRTCTSQEKQIQDKSNRISALETELDREKAGGEKLRRDLLLKLQQNEEELESERHELSKLEKIKGRLEEQLEETKRTLEAKGDEETKHTELQRMRETEMVGLKEEIASLQSELDEGRKRHTAQSEQYRQELDDLSQEHTAAVTIKNSYEKQLAEIQSQIERNMQVVENYQKSLKQANSELQISRSREAELEGALDQERLTKESYLRQLSTANSRNDDTNERLTRLERDKASNQKQIDMLREELEEETQRRKQAESGRRELEMELEELRRVREEDELCKAEFTRKTSSQAAELDELKFKFQSEALERTTELEEAKRRLEKTVGELQIRTDELTLTNSNIEKSKARLTAEVEDLRIELDRDHAATRAAEKVAKATEIQLAQVKEQAQVERHHRELAESTSRKLQTNLDSLNLDLDAKNQQITSLTRSKSELEKELSSLVNEFGTSGKSAHEVEKLKRKMEAQIQELEGKYEEEKSLRYAAEELKRRFEEQLAESRRAMAADFEAKEGQFQETKKILLLEIDELGQQVTEHMATINELNKSSKKQKEQIDDLSLNRESSTRSKTDMERSRKKLETTLREYQTRLEAEERLRKNVEELAARHERKSNTIQSELEVVLDEKETLDRTNKQLAGEIETLRQELGSGDDSKANLLEKVRKLERENQRLQELADEEADTREMMAAAKKGDSSEIEYLTTKIRGEMGDQLQGLEESRKAAVAAQRIAQLELENKLGEIENLEKQRKSLQVDLDDLKSQLEAEILAKNEEAALKRRLAAELQDLQIKSETEAAKMAEMQESLTIYKTKADSSLSKLETAELVRLKAEKSEGFMRLQLKDLEETLQEALAERKAAEERAAEYQQQMRELEDSIEEDLITNADLSMARRRLDEELASEREKHRKEMAENEQVLETIKRKYQKEIRQMVTEIELERANVQKMRDTHKQLGAELEEVNNRFDQELRSNQSWKKDKERLESKINDLTQSYQNALTTQDDQQVQIVNLLSQVREYRAALDEAQAARAALEKIKRGLEQRLDDVGEQFHTVTQNKQTAERIRMALDQEAGDLRERLEEQQFLVNVGNEKLRKAELAVVEAEGELSKERAQCEEALRAKASLEKQVSELGLRIADLEAATQANGPRSSVHLQQKLEEKTALLDTETRSRQEAQKVQRRSERMVRDLQHQLLERDKVKARQDDDAVKMEQKVKTLRQRVEELVMSENNLTIAKRKAERDSMEFKERVIRLEREIEKMRARTETRAIPVA